MPLTTVVCDTNTQVVDNRIVGQVEMGSSGTGEDSGMKAMENKPKSPHRSPMLNRSEGSPRPVRILL